jgi:hypothetical protein
MLFICQLFYIANKRFLYTGQLWRRGGGLLSTPFSIFLLILISKKILFPPEAYSIIFLLLWLILYKTKLECFWLSESLSPYSNICGYG